jgi:uncharacterized protein YjbJ (UPF0337 family)
MNWDQVQGNWKQFKGKVQQQWGKLTDDDLDRVEGRRTEMVGRLQERYGHTKEQAERELDRWTSELETSQTQRDATDPREGMTGMQGNRPPSGENQSFGQKRNI